MKFVVLLYKNPTFNLKSKQLGIVWLQYLGKCSATLLEHFFFFLIIELIRHLVIERETCRGKKNFLLKVVAASQLKSVSKQSHIWLSRFFRNQCLNMSHFYLFIHLDLNLKLLCGSWLKLSRLVSLSFKSTAIAEEKKADATPENNSWFLEIPPARSPAHTPVGSAVHQLLCFCFLHRHDESKTVLGWCSGKKESSYIGDESMQWVILLYCFCAAYKVMNRVKQ